MTSNYLFILTLFLMACGNPSNITIQEESDSQLIVVDFDEPLGRDWSIELEASDGAVFKRIQSFTKDRPSSLRYLQANTFLGLIF